MVLDWQNWRRGIGKSENYTGSLVDVLEWYRSFKKGTVFSKKQQYFLALKSNNDINQKSKDYIYHVHMLAFCL